MKRIVYHKRRIEECLESRKKDKGMEGFKEKLEKMIREKKMKLRSIARFNYVGIKGFPRCVTGVEVPDAVTLSRILSLIKSYLNDEQISGRIVDLPKCLVDYDEFISKSLTNKNEVDIYDSLYPNKGPGGSYETKRVCLGKLRYFYNLKYLEYPMNLEDLEAHGVDFFAIRELESEDRFSLLKWYEEEVPEERKIKVRQSSEAATVFRIYYFGQKHNFAWTSYNRAFFSFSGDISFLQDVEWDREYYRLPELSDQEGHPHHPYQLIEISKILKFL